MGENGCNAHACMVESPCCSPETTTTLLISCIPTQNGFGVKKKRKRILPLQCYLKIKGNGIDAPSTGLGLGCSKSSLPSLVLMLASCSILSAQLGSSSAFGLAWLLNESWLRCGPGQPLLAEDAKCQPLYHKTFSPLWAWRRAGHSDCARPSMIKVRNQPSCLMESELAD